MAEGDKRSPRQAVVGASRASRLRRVVSWALWVSIWQLASMAVGSELLLAGPAATVRRLLALVAQPSFWAIVGFSLTRIALGFVCALALALVLGALGHRWRVAADLLAPPLAVLRSTPIVCIIVLLLMWVGSREVSAVAVFLAAFPALYFAVREGLAHVDARVGEMLRTHRVPAVRRALAHTWPQMLPFLAATCENVCGMSWKAGVAAELIGTPSGSIGERVYQAKILLETADLFAWTLVIIVLSYLCERAFVRMLRASDRLSRRLSLAGLSGGDAAPAVAPLRLGLRDAEVSYDGSRVLCGVSLSFDPGSRSCLTDPSGAGKTTLLRVLAGLLVPSAGEACGVQDTSMVFQDSRLIEGMSVEDNVLLCCGRYRRREEVAAALGELLPGVDPTRPAARLSGGQRRRVELARAVLTPSQVLLLDEPFAALDGEARARARAFVLRELEGRTLVAASHDLADVEGLAAQELRVLQP